MIGLLTTTKKIRSGHWMPLLLSMGMLQLTGCAPMMEQQPPPAEPSPPPVVQPEPVPQIQDEPAPLPRPDIVVASAIQMLERGEGDAAFQLLNRLQQESGEHKTAAWLVRQIKDDPQAMLGTDHTEYTVQSGDSLAQISRRHLGHELWFYLLARYNNIKVPRNLSVDTVLKLPIQAPQLPAFMRTGEEGKAVNISANDLLEQGRHELALESLKLEMQQGALDERGRQLLERAWSLRLDQLMRRGQLDTAEEELAQLLPDTSDTESLALYRQLDNQLKAQRHYQLGINALDRNHLEAAHFSFSQALRYQQNFPEARLRLRQTGNRLTERDHNEALRLMNDGQVTKAAELWESILERDPENRTAQEYLRRIRGNQSTPG